jgi:tRNA pseudouridine38-40 synthase
VRCEDVPVRLRLDLAYDGTDFHGWARQPGLRTVQGTLETALAQVLRVGSVSLTCAGRTDTGVHARGQVVHVDVDDTTLSASAGRSRATPEGALLRRTNGVLDPDVRVLEAQQVPQAFDARFSALWRRYAYRVADAPRLVDPLVRRTVLAWPRPLDLDAMNLAATELLGEHDFGAFCRKRAGATTVRALRQLTWDRDASGIAVATVRADAFCHTMVRSLVGALVAVGEGRRDGAWVAETLRRRTRDGAVRVMRPHGLTLEEVCYPDDDQLAVRSLETRRRRTLDG